mgnify:CR=1 FL=1
MEIDLQVALKDARAKQAQIVGKINALEQEKQQLLQEALKLEGEIRLLLRLEKDTEAKGV